MIRTHERRLIAAIWILLTLAQAGRVAATGSLMSGDAVYYFSHLHSLVVDRDLDPANEIAHFRETRSAYTGRPKIGDSAPRHPVTGAYVNKYPIGTALLLWPAYALVHLLLVAAAAIGVPVAADGYGAAYQLAAGAGTAGYAALGLWCCQRAASIAGAGREDAWWATAIAAAATPWLFYTTLEPLFSHALSAAVAAVFAWGWLRARSAPSWVPWLWLGVAGGVAALVRYQDGVLLAVPALDLARRLRRDAPFAVRALAALSIGCLLGAAPQLLVNYTQFGHPLQSGYLAEGFAPISASRLGITLLSPQVGLLRWSPVAALALAGLLAGSLRRSPLALAGLLVMTVQVCLVSSWHYVTQGHSFGNRMLVGGTVFLVAGLAEVLGRLRGAPSAHRTLVAAGVLAAAVNVALMALWSAGIIGPLARPGV